MVNPTHQQGAEAFIESLNSHGVDQIFLNPGIDTTPVQGVIAKYREQGEKAPRTILCPDEAVAFAAAHGYAMVSGKPQVVMVYSDVGTLQVGGFITNTQKSRMPIILCAGQARSDGLNWLQQPVEQGNIVRNYVKWDHGLGNDENISYVLEEAFQIATTEPCGPVYLTWPREALMSNVGQVCTPASIKYDKAPPETAPGVLNQAADILLDSESPLIMTANSGRYMQSVPPLAELAESLGARVITTEFRMNFPSTHPLCAGIDSTEGKSLDHFIEKADVVLLLDYDFPGPGQRPAPRPDAKIITIDIDPAKQSRPLWGRPADVLIRANSSQILPALNEIICQRLSSRPDTRVAKRSKLLDEEHKTLRETWHALATSRANAKPISAEWLCYCINEVIDEDTIMVHMTPTNAAAVSRQIHRTKPGTLYGSGGGSMGWAMGSSLGAKLAAPDKMVVSLTGDGGFIYGCPEATLWSAVSHRAPFLIIIFNNQAYNSIRGLIRGGWGENSIAGNKGFELGVDIKEPPDFALIAKACRAYGQTVEEPLSLLPALKDAVEQVRRGIPAVLNVRIANDG